LCRGPCPADGQTVVFLRLGWQCPFAGWFCRQAQELASRMGLQFEELDLTGRPDLGAPVGAVHSSQVCVPGWPPLCAPRDSNALYRQLQHPWKDSPCPPKPPVAPRPAGSRSAMALLRPGDAGWSPAVHAGVATCVPPRSAVDREHAAAAKLSWFEQVETTYGPGAAILVACEEGAAGATGAAGFAEVIPASAAHIPLATLRPGDLFLTCVHALGEDGDVRPRILERLLSELGCSMKRNSRMWTVCGLRSCYPNGPAAVFEALGFTVAGNLGKCWLPEAGWDDLELLSWSPAAEGGPRLALVLAPEDNVATLPWGCRQGEPVDVAETQPLTAIHPVPRGHKIALRDIPQGGRIIKYGQTIGQATVPIGRGEWVHVHNVMSARARGCSGE